MNIKLRPHDIQQLKMEAARLTVALLFTHMWSFQLSRSLTVSCSVISAQNNPESVYQ